MVGTHPTGHVTCYAASAVAGLVLLLAGCDAKLIGGCVSDKDCPAPQRCADGRCYSPGPVAEGEPCEQSAECSTGACRDLGEGPVCLVRCGDSNECAEDQLCLPTPAVDVLAADDPALEMLCVRTEAGTLFLGETCTSDGACQSGLCYEQKCSRPCGACPADWTCEPVMITREGLAAEVPLCRRERLLAIQELGAVTTTANGAATLSFDIDPGVDSFVLIADDQDDRAVSIERLDAPDGTRLYDVDDPSGALALPYYGVGTATVLVPGTDTAAGRVKAGTYAVALATYEPAADPPAWVAGDIDRVAVIARRGGGRGGLLDLNLHFAPGTGITADEAPESGYLASALGRLNALYRRLMGIGLGEIRYFDLPAGTDAVDSMQRGRELFAAHSRPGPRGLSVNLFVVHDVSFTGGFAGAVPGPPGLVGRPTSGVLVKRYASAATMGALMAHEIGHYLGLWHTSEPEGFEDPISDTPVCPAGTPEKSCPDYDNLMYPIFPTTDAVELTPGQATVVRGVPWVYELRIPGVCGPEHPAVQLAPGGFASGVLGASDASLPGSCGGGAPGARPHLLRLVSPGLQTLELTVRGHGVVPVVHVRHGGCDEAATELECVRGTAGEPVVLRLEEPAPGAYVVVVGADSGSGWYELRADLIQPESS